MLKVTINMQTHKRRNALITILKHTINILVPVLITAISLFLLEWFKWSNIILHIIFLFNIFLTTFLIVSCTIDEKFSKIMNYKSNKKRRKNIKMICCNDETKKFCKK